MHGSANPPQPAPIPADLLLLAYRNGIFPMADSRDDPEVFWVEPKDRAIIPLDQFHLSRSLRKVLAQDRFTITFDTAFAHVIEACSHPRPGHPDSWISEQIKTSYRQLHDIGHAHSVECWSDGELAGGLYGVSFDRVFCGESMFSRKPNASKVALAWLVAMMRRGGFAVLDCQFMTDHLASMGAEEIPQAEYMKLIAAAAGKPIMGLDEAYSSIAHPDVSNGSGQPYAPGKSIAQSFTQTS